MNDPNITHSVKKYRKYASIRMTHFDPPMGSISALMLKKKSGMGTTASKKEDSCWSRLLLCISASALDCISEESAIYRGGCLKAFVRALKEMLSRVVLEVMLKLLPSCVHTFVRTNEGIKEVLPSFVRIIYNTNTNPNPYSIQR